MIWVDAIAGTTVGILILSLNRCLTDLYLLPGQLILMIGIANLAYGGIALTLALFTRSDHVPFFRVLALANMAWALLCLAWAILYFSQASFLGMGQLIGETIFVGGLGTLEWLAIRRVQP